MSDFDIGTAIVIAGYLLYPLLAVLAVGLLVVALLMLVGASIERRRHQSPNERVRKLPVVLLALVAAITIIGVWSSSPNVPLSLTREQAIARAAPEATLSGRLIWTQLESKLLTYREWNRWVAPWTPGLGYVDTTDQDALLWIVAYRGPMVSSSPDYCEWSLLAFAADRRTSGDWGASECGKGQWPLVFDLLLDRSWLRLDALRGD